MRLISSVSVLEMRRVCAKVLGLCLLLMTVCFTELSANAPRRPVTKDAAAKPEIQVSIQDEWDVINRLITVTERNLGVQQQLRDLLAEYREQQELFFKKDQPNQRLNRMVRLSREILHLIRQNNMEQLFSDNFIHELNVLTQMG